MRCLLCFATMISLSALPPPPVQFLPCGQLSMLWQVLLAWGAPAACQASQQLLKPVVAVVGCALELCSGGCSVQPAS